MADDGAKLVVSLEARLRTFERQMQQAGLIADRQAKQIERKLNDINPGFDAIVSASKRIGIALAGAFSVVEINRAADSFIKVQNALKVAGLQGDQLRATYEQLFAASQRQGTSIEATATLYGRLAAAQKDLGVTQRELLTFTEGVGTALKVAGADAESASGALLQLGQALAGGKIQAEEYNSILDGARPVLQAVADGLIEAGGSVSKLTALVKDGQVSSEAFFRAFLAGLPKLQQQAETAGTTSSQAFERLKNSFINLVGALNEATGASQTFAGGMSSLASAVDTVSNAIPNATKALREFITLRNQALGAAEVGAAAGSIIGGQAVESKRRGELKELLSAGLISEEQFRSELDRLSQSQQQTRAAAQAIATGEPITGSEGRIGAGLSRPKPVSLKQFPVAGDAGGGKKGGGGGGSATLDQYQREIEQIQKRTAALVQEATLVGQSAFAADKARVAFELLEAAKQAGIETTPQLTAEVDRLSTAYAQANETLRATQEAQQTLNDLAQFTGDILSGFFSDIVSGGENAEKALMRLVKSLADAALQAALLGQGPLASLFGLKGANGAVGGLLGAIFGGFRASGGPVSAGRPYIVGENGPELMVPGRSGMVVPNDVVRAAASSPSGGTTVVVNQTFAPGVSSRDLANILPQVRQSAIDGVRDLILRGAL